MQGEIVKIMLKHGARIPFTTTLTGEKGYLTSTHGRMSLIRGRLFKIPVNTQESLDNYHIFKTFGRINEILDVRNLEDGYITLIPIIHNVQITDGMELGTLV